MAVVVLLNTMLPATVRLPPSVVTPVVDVTLILPFTASVPVTVLAPVVPVISRSLYVADETNIAAPLYITVPPHVVPVGIGGFTVHCVCKVPLCPAAFIVPNNWKETIFRLLPAADVRLPFIVVTALAFTLAVVLDIVRLLKVVAVLGTVCTAVPFSSTVPLLWVNVPPAAFTKLPATFNVEDGANIVPAEIVSAPVTSAALAPKSFVPAPLNVSMLNLLAPVMLPESVTVPTEAFMATVLLPALNDPLFIQLPATFTGLAPAQVNVAPALLVKSPESVVVVTEGLTARVTTLLVLLFVR